MSKRDDTNEKWPDGPTDSHILAQIEQDEKGLSQKAGDTSETTDIGWNDSGVHLEQSIVAGISNEDLWMLIRRFNKVSLGEEKIESLKIKGDDLTDPLLASIQCQGCA